MEQIKIFILAGLSHFRQAVAVENQIVVVFVNSCVFVGNGGFSLRSKKWLVRANELHRRPRGLGEDTYANVYNITHFLHAGCTVAPLKLAMHWSFEHTIEEFPKWTLRDSFGFHGLTNRPSRSHLRLNSSSL